MQREDTIIGLDWGSTSLSAYYISADGSLLDSHSLPAGVTRRDRGEIAAALASLVARWPDSEAIYAAGMIGSSKGWRVVPYVDCPCSMSDVARALVTEAIGDVQCFLVPGVARTKRHPFPDVMRGEEMEVFGVAASTPDPREERMIVLPGTHTKWVRFLNDRIDDFDTAMSGELFDILVTHSLLGDAISGCDHDADAFKEGVELGVRKGRGLSRLMFNVRARVLRGFLAAGSASAFLRGVLIGAEVADITGGWHQTSHVELLGNATLCERYREALLLLGIQSRIIGKHVAMAAAFASLHALARDVTAQ